ncbi:MAG: hypothetical protein AAB309_01075 [Deltaproteobacteria bacterium]
MAKVFAGFLLFLFSALSPNLSARDQTDLETSLQKYLKRNEADRSYHFEEPGDSLGSLGHRPRDDSPVAIQLLIKESFLLISNGLNVDIVDASLNLEGTESEEDRLKNLSMNQAKLPILLSFPITKEERQAESPSLSTIAENISNSDGTQSLYSFLPMTTEDGKNFYLIKALGADGMVIDRWELETEMTAEAAMRQFERGKLGAPMRVRIKNVTHSSRRGYDVFALGGDDRGKLSKALHAVYGLTVKEDLILISTPQGIDHVRRDDLLKTHTDDQKEIPIQKTIPLPFTTGVVFLNSISPFGFPSGVKDELMLVSQWNPIIGESALTLFSSIEGESPINQWTLNAPMLGLAKSPSNDLFSPAGKVGIHHFKINPDFASIRGEFIKREATLDPRYYSIEGSITGGWVSESILHFSVSSSPPSASVGTPFILETATEQMIDRARSVHRTAISKAIDTPFAFKQGGKAFLNGLLSSIPFDADKLVDIFGFELDKSLEDQLKAYQVADILTDDEKNEIRNTFSQVRNGGEIIGSAGQIVFALKKIAEFRQFNFKRRAEQAKRINDIRRSLGLAKEDLTASGAPWLSEWKSAELWLADAKIAGFREKFSELLKHTHILLPEKFREILNLIEKTRNYERPFERVWIEIGQVAPIHQRTVQKLEYWTFKRLSQFFESVQPEDFAKAFSLQPSFVQDWERLKHLRLMEELGQFQKLEALALTAKIKSALMEGIASQRMKKLEQSASDSPLIKALKKLQSKAGIAEQEVKTLAIQIKHISDQIEKSEEAYRLARIIELNQPAQELANLEKIEKLRHLIRCGWTGNAAAISKNPKINEELVRALDEMYDHEQMLQSTFLDRMFKHGKLSEAALFTLYSNAANVGIEWWVRKNDGRPFLSSGLAHNLFFNTYIMFPIFASTGFRVNTSGKLFILVFNAVSTGYVNQQFVKFGGELFDTETPYQRWYQQWENLTPYEKATFLVPPPRRPFLDMPGYMMRSIFTRPGEDYNGGWALYDSSWTLGLSTPRGILFSRLGNYLSSRALLDQPGRSFALARVGARFGPVVANETAGAATYTPLYGYFFEKSDHKPIVLDSKLETVDPWLTEKWEEQPKLRLSLSVESLTPLEEVTFLLLSNDMKLDVAIPANQWKERSEQLYELVWEKEISPSDEPTVYLVKNLTLKNKDRWLGDALMPWKERIHEEGVSVEVEAPLMTWVQSKETFTQGLLKVFLSLAKEADTHYKNQRHHLAAGIVYMIAQYLEPFYRELVITEKTHHLISDAFKEARRISQSLNYSDLPIEEGNLGLLVQYLEKLSLEWSLQNLIPFRDETENPRFQRSWIDFHSLKVLSKIQEEILKETRTAWLILDEGDKNDWNTFQLFKGYAYGLLRLYRWYHYHFNEELSQTNRDALTRSLTILTGLHDFGKELETSWLSNLHWSDSYLKALAEKFKELELCLSFGVKRE